MATTMNLKDATKVLVEESSGILAEATRIRKEADYLYDALKRLDAEMNQQREEEAARRRQQEQQMAQSAHTKAFTMLDDDEKKMAVCDPLPAGFLHEHLPCVC